MDSDDRPVLDYGSPPHVQRKWLKWLKWLIPLVSGAGAGYLLSFSAYGWFCCGIVAGFAVGTLSAAFASKQRLAFGLLGNGTTVAACIAVATIHHWRSGMPMPLRDVAMFVVISAGVVCLPGLVGVAVVAGFDSVTRPRQRGE